MLYSHEWPEENSMFKNVRNLFIGITLACFLWAMFGVTASSYGADAHVTNQGNGPAHTSSMKLFTNATGVETGTSFNLQFMPKNHTWFTEITGTASAVNIILEGSIDGTNWFTLDTSTSTTDEMRHVVNKPVKYLRSSGVAFTAISSYNVIAASGGN